MKSIKSTFIWILLLAFSCKPATLMPSKNLNFDRNVDIEVHPIEDKSGITILMGTFLGSEKRNYYGNKAPDSLKVLWKFPLGEGLTRVGSEVRQWAGAGWTGQPLVIKEDGREYLIQGSFDYHLRKIDLKTKAEIWKYKFDDVIKGTATIWVNPKSKNEKDRVIIFQGSRKGYNTPFYSDTIPSFRAISSHDGKELWRYNSIRTPSYSRDVDASPLLIGNTLYIGLENGLLTVLNPNPTLADEKSGYKYPKELQSLPLFNREDVVAHRGNVVTEASPSMIGDRIYIGAGSGHVYGYDRKSGRLAWDFYTGSDIDGSPVVTEDRQLLVSLEKQYIKGPGGVIKLDPMAEPAQSISWYFPVGDKEFGSWEGGVIGSVGVNDSTKLEGYPSLAAIAALDGSLYVINPSAYELDQRGKKVLTVGFDGKMKLPKPLLKFKQEIGPSISTPIFVQDKLIVAGYEGIYLFKYDEKGEFILLDFHRAIFESTPVCIDGKVYIASRNGYLYCFGGE